MNATGSELLRYLRTLAAGRANDACSDRQLLEQFVMRREQASFAALLRRHGPMVLGVCRRVLGREEDAEDAFQATFLVLACKAGSIRKHESLSSWLHGVAYHVAEKLRAKAARRTIHERKAVGRPPLDPAEDVAWREIRCLLDSELAQLPEQFQSPLVLCYLEGKTQDEAARQLEWSLSKLRRRLDRARQLLARRLMRRGLTLSAALIAPIAIENTATAAVPPLLAAGTIRASLAVASGQSIGDWASTSVMALAEGGGPALAAGNVKWALGLLVAVSVAAAGAITHETLADRPATTPPSAPPLARSAGKDKAIEEKDDTIAVNGRVFDPDGKPFSGAKIYLIGSDNRPQKIVVRAVSGVDGRFRFTFPKTEYFEAAWIREGPKMWLWCDIVAAAPGYGPARMFMRDVPPELSLRLRKEIRIEGRVRDREGRPVEDAEVRVIGPYMVGSWSRLIDSAATDKEGRFRLSGVGRDMEMELRVSAPTIETQWIKVKTPAKGPIARIEVLAALTKPIEGTIRGRDTGKPLAGVEVLAIPLGFDVFFNHLHTLRTVTDERGHYRLVGLPKTGSYKLTVVPPAEQGYVIAVKQAADTEGLKPIRLDFDLRRGTIVRLRLIDKETGRPIRGDARYTPLVDNPLRIEAWKPDDPNRFPGRLINYTHQTGKDNFIQFVVYPGPGVVYAVAGWWGLYLPARLDPEDERNGHFPGLKGDPLNGFLDLFSGYRRINPKPTDRLLAFDIVFDPGRTLTGTLVDPAGKPVRGATGWGLQLGHDPQKSRITVRGGEQILETAAFTASGIERDDPCTLSFVHRRRKLIGQITVRPEDKGPLTVRLQPWGTLAGRLVDPKGKPLAEVKIRLKYPGSPDSGMKPPDQVFATDRDGRFCVEGLLPGSDHQLILEPGTVLKTSRTRAGETKDLSDIAVKVP